MILTGNGWLLAENAWRIRWNTIRGNKRRRHMFDHSYPVFEFVSPPKLASFLPHSTWRCLVPGAALEHPDLSRPCLFHPSHHGLQHQRSCCAGRPEIDRAFGSTTDLGAGKRRQSNQPEEQGGKSPAHALTRCVAGGSVSRQLRGGGTQRVRLEVRPNDAKLEK